MVDPNVLKARQSTEGMGICFGMRGFERIAMLKYGVKDLRLFRKRRAVPPPVRRSA
ncbi:MAG: hypothetical protein V8Q54_09575 [Alistipes senegalensis]